MAGLRKITKNLIIVADIQPGILSEHLPNADLESSRYTKPLG
jgi:hypothetical protein